MAKLQVLSVFLTERLTLAAQEIFKAVEDIVSEYNDEMCRSRREIDLLRKRLQQAGLHLDSELQYSSIESQETQTLSDEQWRTEQGGKNAEVKMKVEVHALPEENEVQMFVYNESSSLVACMDTGHDQMANKDIENQIMNTSENDFPFTNQAAEIKNEPGLYSVENRECQLQHFTSHSSDDPEASDASSINKTEVVNFDCLGHKNQAFNLPPRTQERLMHHRVELAQIRERMSSRLWFRYSEHERKNSQPSDCQDKVSQSDKRKEHNARKSQAWRARLRKDPVKFAEYKALEAQRAREYRKKKTAAAKEIERENNRQRQRKLRAKKKLHQLITNEDPSSLFKIKDFLSGEETANCHQFDGCQKVQNAPYCGKML